MAWLLLASGEPRLAASAPFYGPLPEGADFSGSPNAAVLGIYAERDDRVNASRDATTAALERAGLTHEIVTYPGANHAFFNDTGPRYHQAAATQAYAKVLDWFGHHLGRRRPAGAAAAMDGRGRSCPWPPRWMGCDLRFRLAERDRPCPLGAGIAVPSGPGTTRPRA
jgi:hypothetical protein